MKNSKYLLSTFAAIVFVIVAVVFVLHSASFNHADQRAVTSPAPPKQATMSDDSRSELSIERLLDLDHSRGFDPDIVSLLKPQQDEQRGSLNQNFAGYQAIASTTRRGKGDVYP